METNYTPQKPPHIDHRVTIIRQPSVQDSRDEVYIGRTGIVITPREDFVTYIVKVQGFSKHIVCHYSELFKLSL